MQTTREISATTPDWDRERIIPGRYEPGKCLLRTIRRYQQLKAKSGGVFKFAKPWLVMSHRFWSAVSGADIPLNVQIGGGLLIPHPNGIVIHPDAQIGPNCLIFQQVTIGALPRPGLPVIGGHVDIGAGAKVLGGIHIGDHARIGANSVVLQDVAAQATAVGIPAKILRSL